MMKAVLKTLAISFGGGLALGAGMRLTQGPTKTRRETGVDLGPLLSRIQTVESRIVEMEAEAPRVSPAAGAPATPHFPEKTLAAFESRLAEQLVDVQQMRGEIRRVDQRLGELDSKLPVIIQSTVDVRFHEVERKLQQDFEHAQSRSVAAFVETLQSKVVERITTLETNLAEQSQAIGKLRDTSLRTDQSLQKMLIGIERLVDQSRSAQTASAAPPTLERAAPQSQPVGAGYTPQRDGPHTEIGEHPETLAAHLATVRESVTQHSNEKLPARELAAALVSEAPQATSIPQHIPGVAPVPEMAYSVILAEGHTHGALSETGPSPPETEAHAAESLPIIEPTQPTETPLKSEESYEWVNRIGLELLAPRPKTRLGWRIPLVVGLVAGLILIVGLFYWGMLPRFFDTGAAQQNSTLASAAPAAETSPAPSNAGAPNLPALPASVKPADPASFVELGREYTRRKDWAKAEAAYRSALEATPGNRDAALGLSDVLYQEQKYEESAAVLNKLSSSAKPQ
jgi:uncharacterized coiled-coil protein SlyX